MNNIAKKYRPEDEFNIQQLIREIFLKWHYFVIAGLIFTGLAFIYIKFSLPVYQSNSSILVDDSKSGASNFEDFLSSDLFGTNLNLPTEIGILKSRTVIQKTIDRLNLSTQYWSMNSFPSQKWLNYLLPAQPLYPKSPLRVEVDTFIREFKDLPFEVKIIDEKSYELEVEYDGDKLPYYSLSKKFDFGQTVKTDFFSFRLYRNEANFPLNGGLYRFEVRSTNKLVAEILLGMTAEAYDKEANIIKLSYQDVIPLRALDILNTVGKVYIDLDVQDKAEVASLTLKFVDEQLDNTGTSLSNTEHEMQVFKEKNKTVDLSEESRNVLQKVNELDVERVKNSIELASLENLYNYVQNNDDITKLAPSSLGIPDPLLVELITDYQALQVKRRSISYGIKDDAPAVKIVDQQIRENKATLIENIRSIQKRMIITRNSISSQLAQYEESIKHIPEIERELLGIKRNFEVNQNIYTFLLQKKAETSIAKATAVSDNKILDESSLSDEPIAPNKKLIAVIILLLTLIVPTGIITAGSLMRTTVMNRDDITSLTEVPVIGVVGHSDDSNNLIVQMRPKSAIAEAFRTVRTNMKFFGTGNKCKTVLITSSVGGEGKSFITLNLATVLAMQQHKVLVIGLDLRKPKLYQDFGWKNDVGASSYLVGVNTVEEVIRKTNIPGLDIIISGPIPPNPAELLSKVELTNLLNAMKDRYDYIILDTPPIGVVSDAFLIMPNTDINLYVVRQGYSKLEFLKSLEELYKDNKIPNACILLNDSDFALSSGYGHHYGYINGNAGYYDEQELENEKWSRGWRRLFFTKRKRKVKRSS